MNTQKILLNSLFAGGVLALVRLASARAASSNPAPHPSSYAAIDAYVEEQLRRLNIPGASLAIVEGEQIVQLPVCEDGVLGPHACAYCLEQLELSL